MKRISVTILTDEISPNEPLVKRHGGFKAKFTSFGFMSYSGGFRTLKDRKIKESSFLPDVLFVRDDVDYDRISLLAGVVKRFNDDVFLGVLTLGKASSFQSAYIALGARYVGYCMDYKKIDHFLMSIPGLKMTIADKFPLK